MTSLSQPNTPPTSEPPFKGPKTCDASEMLEIHRALRRSFGEATALVDGVAEGNTKHANAVATQLNLISTVLHAHYEGEDSRLWDMVSDRAPACFLHVDRMKRQDAGMLVHLEDLDRTLPAWRATATKEAAEPIRSALHGVSAAMAEHFPDEETTIVPVMEHVLTQREENWFPKHGRAATPKGSALEHGRRHPRRPARRGRRMVEEEHAGTRCAGMAMDRRPALRTLPGGAGRPLGNPLGSPG